MVAINDVQEKGPCDVSVCTKNGVSQTGVQGKPKGVRFGDYLTWTTSVDWDQQGSVQSGLYSGEIYPIELWGKMTVFNRSVQEVEFHNAIPQPATSSTKVNDPAKYGRWRIVPKDPSNMGRQIFYGDTERTFYLQFAASGAEYSGMYLTLMAGNTWPFWPTKNDREVTVDDVKAELMFADVASGSLLNNHVLGQVDRANNSNPVLYGDVMAMEIRNQGDGQWAFGNVLRTYRKESEGGSPQAGMGTYACDGTGGYETFGPMWPIYPWTSASPWYPYGGDKDDHDCVRSYWNTDHFTYNFMMWPDGTVGYAHINEENSCACQCQALVNQQNGTGSNGDWQFCPRSGQFSTCGLAKDKEYRWSSCNVVLSCQTGKLIDNVCGDMPAQNILPGDTVACCDPVEQKWKARSPSAPEGVAYACIYNKSDSANYAKATEQVDKAGCKQTIWQCRPPETNATPLNPLLDTPARAQWRASQRKSSASSSTILPLGPTQEGAMNSQFTCDIQDKPILLCADS